MIFIKISQNFIKSPLKLCLISQISVHSLWLVCHLHFLGHYSVVKPRCSNFRIITAMFPVFGILQYNQIKEQFSLLLQI